MQIAPMYQLVSHRRRDGELVIELKNRFNDTLVLPAIVLGVAACLVLLHLPPLVLAVLVLVGFYSYYFRRVRVILYYDAGSLRVVRSCDFEFWQWHRQTLYDRADVPQPVIWAHVIRSGKNESFHLASRKIRQYQTRFPYAYEKNLGGICVHNTEWEMRQLQKEIDAFFTETPYDKSLHERAEAAIGPQSVSRDVGEKEPSKQVRNENREEKRRKSRFNETKGYAFDRGETRIRRGDESLDKGESKPKRDKTKRSRQRSGKLRHDAMVKVDEQISVDLKSGTLNLVSTTQSLFSSFMATMSVLCYRLAFLIIILGAPTLMYLHYAHGPETSRRMATHAQRLIEKYVPDRHQESFGEALQSYVDACDREDERLHIVGYIFLGCCGLILFFSVAAALIRWPFWGRWTVKMNHTNARPYEILFSWRNDRGKSRETSKGFVVFFRVISATPRTNHLLTGQTFRDNNPGWKQPCQVVLITDEGSFPLPCGSVDEQERIIKCIRRFVDGVLPKNE